MGRRLSRILPPLVIALLAAAVAAPLAFAAGGPKKLAFPVGWWVGTGTFTGSVSKDQTRITQHGGSLWFTLVVNRDEEVEGTMEVSIPETVSVRGGSGSATITGTLELSGEADKVEMDGELRATGSGNAMGFTFPIDVVVPPYTTFEPESVSCTHVTGDLAKAARAHNAALGFSSSLRQPFVAVRVDKKPNKANAKRIADQLTSSYQAAFSALRTARVGGGAEELDAAVDEIEQLLASAGDFGECGGSGALQGVRIDCALMTELQLTVDRLLAAEPEPRELLEITFLAARLGIFDGADWCAANTKTYDALEGALVDAVKAAVKAGDAATLRNIGVASAMYGLEAIYEDVNEELFDEAK